MRCKNPNCGVENREGAKFCRNCGNSLHGMGTSVIDRFPEYNLEPVSNMIEKNKDTKFYWICFLFFAAISICSMIGLIWIIIKSFSACYIGEIIGMSILAVLTIISISYSRKMYRKARKLSLLSQYDYIENKETSSPYRLVINNSKFGLVDYCKKRSLIPCEYDYLKWKSQDKILTATIGKDVFDVDIYGNRLK